MSTTRQVITEGLPYETDLFVFDSMGEMMDEVKAAYARNACGSLVYRMGNWLDDERWVGRGFAGDINQLAKAVDAAWPHGLNVYDRMMAELADSELPQPKSLRRQRVWSEDAGDEVDIDRLRRGQAYWQTTRRQHRPGPLTATVVADVCTLAKVNWDKILWRGAATVCLTEILERAGYRVELWGTQYVTSEAYDFTRRRGFASGVCLKRTGDTLDVSTLINCLSGWSYRTLYFGSYFLGDYKPSSGLGNPGSPRAILKHITPDEQAYVAENIWNHHSAVEWVRCTLADIMAR